jgi:hypothetical protein
MTLPEVGMMFRLPDALNTNLVVVATYPPTDKTPRWRIRARYLGQGLEIWVEEAQWATVIIGYAPKVLPKDTKPTAISRAEEIDISQELQHILKRLSRYGPKKSGQQKLGLKFKRPTPERTVLLEAIRDTAKLLTRIVEDYDGSE